MSNVFIWCDADLDGAASYTVLSWYYGNRLPYRVTTVKNFKEEFEKWVWKTDLSKYEKIFIVDIDVPKECLNQVDNKNFVIVDAAMNDFIRPTLYDAVHPIIPVKLNNNKNFICDIVGPICETGDYFLQNTKLQKPNNHDLLAITNTGAYGSVMSSNYNSRSPAAEVMILKGKTFLIKEREKIEEQINREKIL